MTTSVATRGMPRCVLMGGAVLCALTGCGVIDLGELGVEDDGFATECGRESVPLLISEFLSHPVSANDVVDPLAGVEWIELHNLGPEPVVLDPLVLRVQGGGAPRDFTLGPEWQVPAGGFFVLGGRGSETSPEVMGTAGFQLTNSGASIELRCADVVIDRLDYGERGGIPAPEEGTSAFLDGDALSSDEPTSAQWCTDGLSGHASSVSTPGLMNAACRARLTCEDELAAATPLPGDLVISEVFADPDGSDGDREWLEILNRADEAIGLDGLSIVNRSEGERLWTLPGGVCTTIEPLMYMTFGSNIESAANGGVMIDVGVEGLSLYNRASTLELIWNGQVIDQALLDVPQTGRSMVRLDLSRESDGLASAFCPATEDGGFDGFGTPGVEGGACIEDESGVPPGDTSRQCDDVEGTRAVVRPEPGELVISEVFADATGADDGREYIELLVDTDRPVDLNGTILEATGDSGSTRERTFEASDCLVAEPGAYVVIGTERDRSLNGGLHLDISTGDGGSFLYNGRQTLKVIAPDLTEVDVAVVPPAEQGRSVMVDVESGISNDEAASWCLDTTTGVFDEMGSPGFAGVCDSDVDG
ncbi:MAG: lamin tail domain-containing protein [Myxococcota bacterium]